MMDFPTAPCVKLGCGHIFHYSCIERALQSRWNGRLVTCLIVNDVGARISFRYAHCALCNTWISTTNNTLQNLMESAILLRNEIQVGYNYD